MGVILSKSEILRLIQQQPPLLEDYIDLEQQVQPNGVDLTLRSVALLGSAGKIAFEAGKSGRG